MDFDKLKQWMELAQRVQGGGDFWNNILNDDFAYEFIKKQSQTMNHPPPSGNPQNMNTQPEFPLFDLYLFESQLLIIFEVPGVNKEDIHLSVEVDTVCIRGTIHPPFEGQHAKHTERHRGPFERKIKLPVPCDGKNISAKFNNGLLYVGFQIITPSEVRINID